MMKNLFEQSRSHWVRYDHYELKTAEDGKRYITPGKSAKPDVYNPLKEVPNIVLDALNVGMLMMGRKPEAEVEKAVMEFITRYGLLGLMTALPTTPTFMEYEAVYLPKNHFIKEESMATDKYLSLFYPFDQLDLVKKGIESTWNVSGDRTMVALTMTFMDEPMAKNMSFQRAYAELERQGYIYSVKGRGSFVADNRQIRERKRQEIWDQLELLIRDAKGTGITMLEFQEQVIQSYGSEEGGNRNDKG